MHANNSIYIMILTEFSYRESSGWQLEKLTLHHQNLIVGMNSVGKSRTLEALGNVIRFIKNDSELAKRISLVCLDCQIAIRLNMHSSCLTD